MSHRFFSSTRMSAVPMAIVVLLLFANVTLAGQRPAARNWTPSRTAWGDPDLQGVYTFSTLTPLERPNVLTGKGTYTEAELAQLEDQVSEQRSVEGELPTPGDPGTYNNFWTSNEKGKLTGRTSLIVEPEDGRKPQLTPQGQKTRQVLVAEAAGRRVGVPPFVHTLYKTWQDHPAFTRCLSRPMPRIGQSYNHGIQVLQTPGQVVIHYESMHDVRVIPLDGRPHLDPAIQQWNGDSRGHWEGNTLVVDWSNFTQKQEFEGAPQGTMHIVERFTRIDANTINYEITVNDPATWTRPWTFSLPWRADDPGYQNPEDLYEYACHEGNYRMMEDSLSGSRALQQGETGKK